MENDIIQGHYSNDIKERNSLIKFFIVLCFRYNGLTCAADFGLNQKISGTVSPKSPVEFKNLNNLKPVSYSKHQ